jgi:hypothetical protein
VEAASAASEVRRLSPQQSAPDVTVMTSPAQAPILLPNQTASSNTLVPSPSQVPPLLGNQSASANALVPISSQAPPLLPNTSALASADTLAPSTESHVSIRAFSPHTQPQTPALLTDDMVFEGFLEDEDDNDDDLMASDAMAGTQFSLSALNVRVVTVLIFSVSIRMGEL